MKLAAFSKHHKVTRQFSCRARSRSTVAPRETRGRDAAGRGTRAIDCRQLRVVPPVRVSGTGGSRRHGCSGSRWHLGMDRAGAAPWPPGKPRIDDPPVIGGILCLCCRLAAAGQRRPPRTGRAHHDRQPRRRVVSARCRAAPVCQERRRRPRGRRADARCRSRDGTPLGIGWKRGRSQAIGRFPGGFTRKIHCAADGRGRPVAYAPTLDPRHPTDRAGIRLALTLRQPFVPPKRPITDAASDAQSLRDWLETREGGGALRRTRAQPRSAQFVVEPKASPARLRTGEVGSLRQTACPPSAHGR